MLSIFDIVSQFGLAAGISLYLIYFITKELKHSIDKLASSIDSLCNIIDQNQKEVERLRQEVYNLRDDVNYLSRRQNKQ